MQRKRLFVTLLLISFIMSISNLSAFASDIDNSQNDNVQEGELQSDDSELVYDDNSYLLGCKPDSEDFLRLYFRENNNIPDRATLPSSCDLSQDSYFPPIGDQGQVGSCTSWAATYYQFTYQVARLNNWNAKTNSNFRFSPRWTYNFCNGGINEGSSFESTYMILKNTGAARWNDFIPSIYDTIAEYRNWSTDINLYRNALKYRVSDLSVEKYETDMNILTPITSPNNSGLLTMKNYINSGHILTFSSKWNTPVYKTLSSQYNSSLNGKKAIISFNNTNTTNSGHSLSIVGYDDNIWYDLNNNHHKENYEKGAFKVANSHNTTYQNDGYVWVMYDALNQRSNANNLNTSNRESFIQRYTYYRIEVAEQDLDLTAEVTINHTHRNEIVLSTADYMNNSVIQSFLNNSGGDYGFSGYNENSTATFVFDYGELHELNNVRRYVSLRIDDGYYSAGAITNVPTKVQRLKIIDKTGKIVVDDTDERIINNTVQSLNYKIGLVGDVDNDATVDITDATRINNFIADLINFTNEDLLVSDTDADNSVTIMDVTHLQRYLVGIISNMNNGIYEFLG